VQVLVVDDQAPFRQAVRAVLRHLPGFAIAGEAETGERSVELAAELSPALVLMDINLPGISGIDAMRALRADPATAHIPVIALSANAVPRDIEKALEAGFANYLTKPINVLQFLEALDAALASVRPATKGVPA